MSSRREFIQRGAAALAVGALPMIARLMLAKSGSEPYQFFMVMADRSTADGEAFAAEAAKRGAALRTTGGDVGSVWMNDVEPRWKDAPVAIAGLTSGVALFCLELLAADYRMRVVYRAEHSPAADGGIRHIITGPENVMWWRMHLNAAGRRWGAVAAAMAMSCPVAFKPDPGIALLNLDPGSQKASLFSWVIAPSRRALLVERKRSEEFGIHSSA